MTEDMLSALIGKYSAAITCFCFMGGDAEPMEIMRLARWIRSRWPEIRTAWYSGKESIPEDFDITCLDYIKLGPYIEALGGLKSPDTNQALYRIASDATLTRIYIK
jgi:anaerobic ribonucleoside-triphosphate reductase activating protein